ncbi:nucleoside recognition domain-containing protein [Aquirufa aurantiipilula]|uniref:Nucleoside recognition domain-containing protein n=1 Tax=Aquirufa aurantiipilula TaxID=2696561 RepID=A0ABT6BIJ2_9BACT|nr:nucleoside recognition domain-containing protein [Aquirufa aurantiipilula]MDF5690276.1 nucleoside recognition domain-containing protein [Aquirufa aurantiipilula]
MALNWIWFLFFGVAFVVALIQFLFFGNAEIFKILVDGMFDSAEMAVMKIALPLAGVMTFFMGILQIGEKAGAIQFLARRIRPFFTRLFPEIPADHPVHGQMIMNFSANLLGLDNAATPFGLKAMQGLQDINPTKETASNAQIMFLTLHSAGPVLIPLSIMAQRAIYGAQDASDVFIPCLMATYAATLVGLMFVAVKQKINLLEPVLLSWLVGLTLFFGGILAYFSSLSKEQIEIQSKIFSNGLLFTLILSFIVAAFWKKIDIFSTFVEGAKGGFETSVKIIPYLVGMLVAISCLRNSGTLDFIVEGMKWMVNQSGLDTRFIDAMPTALLHPVSGSGSRAMMIDTMKTFGADSFVGRLACVFQGSAETILYVIALYFGSVQVKNIRYTLLAGLTADLAGIITAIFVSYLFFG